MQKWADELKLMNGSGRHYITITLSGATMNIWLKYTCVGLMWCNCATLTCVSSDLACVFPCRYCNQVLSKEIDESVTLLLQELVRFQERVYQKDPTKAKSKRRLVMGLREVTKHMKLHKIKCVIISPNCEKIQAKGTESPSPTLFTVAAELWHFYHLAK